MLKKDTIFVIITMNAMKSIGDVIDMYQLPMKAFKIRGNAELIRLSITRVWGYPDKLSPHGGYTAKGILEMKVGGYSVYSEHNYATGELYPFYKQLIECYDKAEGTAVLENAEGQLELSVNFYDNGKVVVNGCFQENKTVNTKLIFEMKTDYAMISYTIENLKKAINVFGDEKGVSNPN